MPAVAEQAREAFQDSWEHATFNSVMHAIEIFLARKLNRPIEDAELTPIANDVILMVQATIRTKKICQP